jgi:molecular chaperone GrpE
MRQGASRGCFTITFMTEPTMAHPTDTDTSPEVPPTETAGDDVAVLRARLEEAEAGAASARDAQLRALAELDNVRKRAEREIDNGRKFGAERLLNELLAIADSLDLGLQAAAQPDASAQSIAHGMQLTQKQLTDLLAKHGVAVVDPVGQPFNPDLHEAVSAVPSAGAAPNSVLSVMQKGYRLHERLLRPAMVMVAKAP